MPKDSLMNKVMNIQAHKSGTKWADENMYNEKMNGNGKQTIDLTSFGFIHIEHNVWKC